MLQRFAHALATVQVPECDRAVRECREQAPGIGADLNLIHLLVERPQLHEARTSLQDGCYTLSVQVIGQSFLLREPKRFGQPHERSS